MKYLLFFFLFISNLYSEFNFINDYTIKEPDVKITTPIISFEPIKYSIPENLEGEKLFDYLHEITKQQFVLTYDEAKQKIFYEVDNTLCPSGKNGVWAFYSNICVEGKYNSGSKYIEYGDMNLDGYIDSKGMNIEHIWPQGYFNSNYPMVSDLNHLRPTFITPNNKRANFPFYYVTNPVYIVGSSGARLGNGYFEPPDKVKGDVARVLFYFVVRYYDRSISSSMDYDNFFISKIKTYMLWNRLDPPDDNEKRRNDLVYKYQGNRNPFIDNPELIEKIGEVTWSIKRPKIIEP
jgi:hypothetical protein